MHGVLPAIGAAAVYRRFKAGTEGEFLAGKVLGENAAEMTAVSKGVDNLRACRYTLRAIVQIAQEVRNTSMRYE